VPAKQEFVKATKKEEEDKKKKVQPKGKGKVSETSSVSIK
jgi:hypothetical protein